MWGATTAPRRLASVLMARTADRPTRKASGWITSTVSRQKEVLELDELGLAFAGGDRDGRGGGRTWPARRDRSAPVSAPPASPAGTAPRPRTIQPRRRRDALIGVDHHLDLEADGIPDGAQPLGILGQEYETNLDLDRREAVADPAAGLKERADSCRSAGAAAATGIRRECDRFAPAASRRRGRRVPLGSSSGNSGIAIRRPCGTGNSEPAIGAWRRGRQRSGPGRQNQRRSTATQKSSARKRDNGWCRTRTSAHSRDPRTPPPSWRRATTAMFVVIAVSAKPKGRWKRARPGPRTSTCTMRPSAAAGGRPARRRAALTVAKKHMAEANISSRCESRMHPKASAGPGQSSATSWYPRQGQRTPRRKPTATTGSGNVSDMATSPPTPSGRATLSGRPGGQG